MLTLHTAPGSCSRASHIALEEAGLDYHARYVDFARMQAFNLYLAAPIHVAHAHGRRAARWSDDPAAQASMAAKVSENMSAGFDLIEAGLDGEWVMGDAYSVADPYLFVFSGWLAGDGVDIARFPKVAYHFQRMARRPAVQRVLAWEAVRAG